MIRDYTRGVSESLDFEVTNAGAGIIPVKADLIYSNAFSSLTLYTDSARLIPISSSAYEMSTIDTILTAEEAKTGGSGLSIYADYEILDPTYQTGTIYGTIENYGTYTNGVSVGQDLTVISASDTYTTKPNVFLELFEASGLSADITLTITNGGSNQRNKLEIANIDSIYKVVVTDGTNTYWVNPGETVSFWFKNNILTRSNGWGAVYYNPTNTGTVLETSLTESVSTADIYMIESWTSGAWYSTCISVYDVSQTGVSADLAAGSSVGRFSWVLGSPNYFRNEAGFYIRRIRKWYN